MTIYKLEDLPYKYNVLIHTPKQYNRDELCLEVIQRKEYYESVGLFITLSKEQVDALEHLGVEMDTLTPVFYSPGKFASMIETIPALEKLAMQIRYTARIPEKKRTTCSRCLEDVVAPTLASKSGEIPFCVNCIGTCRMCSRDGFDEEQLEHGVCMSCCEDMDEAAAVGYF